MSRDTSIYVGTYLICTMGEVTETFTDEVPTCTKSAKHPVLLGYKFCPKCKADVVLKKMPRVEKDFLSLHRVCDGDYKMGRADKTWLLKNFEPTWGDDNLPVDKEVILCDGHTINGDDAGEHELSQFEFKQPTDLEIERLKALMKYTDVRVRTGVVVRIS